VASLVSYPTSNEGVGNKTEDSFITVHGLRIGLCPGHEVVVPRQNTTCNEIVQLILELMAVAFDNDATS
jgi:hypothetical protein